MFPTIMMSRMNSRCLFLVVLAAFSASAQTNLVVSTNRLGAASNATAQIDLTGTNQGLALAQRVEDMRAECIQNRRLICGKILKVLPDGLVVALFAIAAFTNPTGVDQTPSMRSTRASGFGAAAGGAPPAGAFGAGTGWFHA